MGQVPRDHEKQRARGVAGRGTNRHQHAEVRVFFFRNRELEELFGKTDTVEGRLQVCMFFLNLSVFFVFCTNRGNMLLCA